MPIIEISNLTKKFGKLTILNDISFSIKENEIFGIIGQSGSGKTVLLKTIVGFYEADAGEIKYFGKELSKHKSEIIPQIGFASQKHSIYYDLTVKENLKYFGRLYGMKKKDISEGIKRVLALVELEGNENKIVGKMSGGMQRRLDIACSLLHTPKILIMDEPESGLDPVLRKHIAEIIRKIRDDGTTVVLSSHFMDEIEPLCDRIAMIKKGVLVAYGSPIEIISRNLDRFEIVIRSYPGRYKDIVNYIQRSGIKVLGNKIENNRLMLYVPANVDSATYLKYVLGMAEKLKEQIIDVQLNQISLEDLFERMVI